MASLSASLSAIKYHYVALGTPGTYHPYRIQKTYFEGAAIVLPTVKISLEFFEVIGSLVKNVFHLS